MMSKILSEICIYRIQRKKKDVWIKQNHHHNNNRNNDHNTNNGNKNDTNNGINNNTDNSKIAMGNKHNNESKLMAIWQAMPTRPRVILILVTVSHRTYITSTL
jgi:hypothetical protein